MESVTENPDWKTVSEAELVYRTTVRPSQRPAVQSTEDVYELFRHHWDGGKIEFVEQFKVLLLNRANRALGLVTISTGGVAGTVADPKLIFLAAIKANASSIVLAHNHPSGSLGPSGADTKLTRKLVDAGKLLDINVLDHLIITNEGFYSFANEGAL